LYTDGNYHIEKFHLTYIRKPKPINWDDRRDNVKKPVLYTELPDHTHSEIVKMAVQMALTNISDPRSQYQSAEVAMME
jgi:hypothetical protein